MAVVIIAVSVNNSVANSSKYNNKSSITDFIKLLLIIYVLMVGCQVFITCFWISINGLVLVCKLAALVTAGIAGKHHHSKLIKKYR